MLQKIFATGIAIACSVSGFAQSPDTASLIASASQTTAAPLAPAPPEDKKPFLTISGSADVYYRLDFSKQAANNKTSFTGTHNTFALGMASVKLEHKTDKLDMVADLGFGPRAKEFAYTDEGITQAIKQLYISYSATNWLKFTAGTWATHVGYELLDPQLNRNYSMSYMFTNGPFSHTGVKAEISKGKSGFMIGVANATDYRTPPAGQINKKFLIAQYSFAASDNLKFYLNYVGGKNPDTSKTSQFDLVATAKLSNAFSLGFNGTVNTTQTWDGSKNESGKSWWGSALYLNLDPKPWFGLTLRTEYFSDEKQMKIYTGTDKGANVFATTLSANFKTGGFIFIPEFRIDNSSQDIFIDANGAPKKSAGSFLLAAIYSF
ncbi:outer membrane beta-barrel protein [Flavihumibacter profundi]|uniref:outer membrane beta-barrel protein n=1 Tax=Flavihumibacter profundi TaxID=2716883 RepID=UPI001CC6FDE9|nr:outer membrane beta-barrel protein [Flavihumibacter profundi]MBZ5859112.1 porin [Flavihumibacter profundi]